MRLFYALELDFFTRDKIRKAVQELRRKTSAGKWTLPDNYHLTVQFLGEYEPESLPELQKILRLSAAEIPPFNLDLGGWGSFGQHHDIIWLGTVPDPSLAMLADRLASQLRSQKMSFDDRPFSPHLTIGRQVRFHAEAGTDLAALWQGPSFRAQIRIVSLMESIRMEDRLVYRSLAREVLKG